MDRRSWLWRRKSSEKSPGGETESSGSASSHSERFSDDQEMSRVSPNHTQSPEVSSNQGVTEMHDPMKSLTEKLSAALSNISAKEDLVKQHAKVAEEAVSGWEKAENEVVVLKQQLEAAAQKNSALEDRVSHLDGALKECVRQLRQTREEQEHKIHDAVVKKTREWEATKFELESKLAELQTQLEASKVEANAVSVVDELWPKLEAAEKENSALKQELLAHAEELKVRTMERELSTRAAETASKQHLESIKKVAKLEAECRRLRSAARKSSPGSDQKLVSASSMYVESLTDSQSDSGERMLAVESDIRKMGSLDLNECEPSCSDSWASALIAELDQFRNDKAVSRSLTSASKKLDLMDDFLEMERLAAMPETDDGSHGSDTGPVTGLVNNGNGESKAQLEVMLQKMTELEEKLKMVEGEKVELEMALSESHSQLETSRSQLLQAEEKLAELERMLASANELKQAAEVEVKAVNDQRKAAELRLEALDAEVQTLHVKVGSLEAEVKEEGMKCQKLEDELSKKKHEVELRRAASLNGELKLKQEKELAVAAGKLAECQKTIASLGQQLKSLASLEDFLLDPDMQELNGGSPIVKGSEHKKSHSSDTPVSKTEADSSKTNGGSSTSPTGHDSTPSSSSSSSVTNGPEKSRNAFGKLFSRSRNGTSRVEIQ